MVKIPMTKTNTHRFGGFGILKIGYWCLFVFWNLLFGVFNTHKDQIVIKFCQTPV